LRQVGETHSPRTPAPRPAARRPNRARSGAPPREPDGLSERRRPVGGDEENRPWLAAPAGSRPPCRSACWPCWARAAPAGARPGPAPAGPRRAGRTAASFPAADEDYFHDMDGGVALTAAEVAGRNTWIVWTGGNDRFWDRIGETSLGALDFLKTLSSHPK